MSLFSVILQEAARRERDARTILGFFNEQMDAVDREGRRRRSLKQRLGFKVIGCCGATWGIRENPTDEDDGHEVTNTRQGESESESDPVFLSPNPANSGMNLATALAAERRIRALPHGGGGEDEVSWEEMGPLSESREGNGTPLRVSLMRLLEETEGGVAEKKREESGNDTVCCVCMGRKKGAAFIPCGHTFCRICSRELWLNRGSCPLCNRSIIEILDLF